MSLENPRSLGHGDLDHIGVIRVFVARIPHSDPVVAIHHPFHEIEIKPIGRRRIDTDTMQHGEVDLAMLKEVDDLVDLVDAKAPG